MALQKPNATIAAIILAAGGSRRMGVPKPLLLFNGTTFLRHLIDLYQSSSVQKIVVVLGARAHDVNEQLQGLDVIVALNQDYARGQLSSIILGVQAGEDLGADGVIIHPVDHPLINTSLVDALVSRFVVKGSPIIIPICRGKRGHPVLFSRALFDELKNAPQEIGARAVVRLHHADVDEIETDEEGVLVNIDTLEDYRHLKELVRC
jgi:molybdenum cofactor cytidylyltransferase